MVSLSRAALDDQLSAAFDEVGVVGTRFRASLAHELKANVLLRDASDAVRIVGEVGTGRRMVATTAHFAAQRLLGRTGPKLDLDCGVVSDAGFEQDLRSALDAAADGTLVLERYEQLDQGSRAAASRIVEGHSQAKPLVIAISQPETTLARRQLGPSILVKPLHEREEDVWELMDHFFSDVAAKAELGEACRGLSRQAKADIAEVVQEVELRSVRRLRNIIRDVVYNALAAGPLPLKLTSEHVRPFLERNFAQTDADRRTRERDLITSQFDDVVQRALRRRFSDLHSVPEDLLDRQAAILRDIVASIDDVPRSYRNIMDRAEDIQRVALWLVTNSETQAEFRRFFGDERFMRPTKSVAWAFYNRVFKRDM